MKFSLTQGYRRPDGILSAFANDQRKESVMDEKFIRRSNHAWNRLDEPFQELSIFEMKMLHMEVASSRVVVGRGAHNGARDLFRWPFSGTISGVQEDTLLALVPGTVPIASFG